MKHNESKKEYIRRINKVQDYLEKNISQPFTLDELAKIAGFSKYHFHRIFKAITHESLNQYVNRFKVERSAQLLSHRLDMNITEIAYYMGFSDSAVYSRSFKHLFKVSPNVYRKNYRKNCKDQFNISRYNRGVSDIEKRESKQDIEGTIEIMELDKIKVAYLRFTGGYDKLAEKFPRILEKLLKSAYKQELFVEDKTKILSAYHDHPEFSDSNYFKTSLGITVPDDVKVDENSELCLMEIPAGKYMVGHFYIQQHLYSAIWDYIYEQWLTTSGYAPGDSFPFEVYLNNYRSDPNKMHLVDIYLPVVPL